MRNILFLQGPLGPFFNIFAKKLSALGNNTYKINFNGGDTLFGWADQSFNYRGSIKTWPRYLSMFLKKNKIDLIFVYGDCRRYHSIAKTLAETHEIDFWVFEEGYIRPNFITLEQGGVNANSKINFEEVTHQQLQQNKLYSINEGTETTIGSTFRQRLAYSMSYYTAAFFARRKLINDGHHRQYSVLEEGLFWLRFTFRKSLYTFSQKKVERHITQYLSSNYFFVPLQVHCDSQILSHSDYNDVREFIQEVMTSFSEHSPEGTYLVLKHHPMDLGFTHYGKLIRRYARLLGIQERVIYAHELHLPTMLKNCIGTVTVNSTVGISALIHGKPTKVLGRANYDIPGLTSKLPLDKFWQQPQAVNMKLFNAYRLVLKQQTQINGNFYKNLNATCDEVIRWMRSRNIMLQCEAKPPTPNTSSTPKLAS